MATDSEYPNPGVELRMEEVQKEGNDLPLTDEQNVEVVDENQPDTEDLDNVAVVADANNVESIPQNVMRDEAITEHSVPIESHDPDESSSHDDGVADDAEVMNDADADHKEIATKEAPEEGEDLEDGEIDDEEEDDSGVQEVKQVVEEVKSKDRENRRRSDSKGHEADGGEGDAEDADRRSKHKRHKSDRKDRKDRSRRDLEKEIRSDEEKKRILKEKLRALERQMGNDDEGEEEEEIDDEEMGIYASGGSPSRRASGRKRMVDENGESDPDSRSESGSPTSKRQRRHDKRERGHRSSEREIRPRNGRGHGGGPPVEKSSEICSLFMQGKCPKNAQNCSFSHDAEPPKIMELCKFYLFERCAKKEKCLYLHKGFPCKYFHTGKRCLDTAETCKFSHEPLTDVTRNILLKHLESAPKEILGDFPRYSREDAMDIVFRTEAKNKGWLDEFENEMPGHMRNQTRSAGDSFIEHQHHQHMEAGDPGYMMGGPDDQDRKRRHSRWGDHPPPENFRGGPPFMHGPGFMGPMGPRGPGPRGGGGGRGLLGHAPPSLLGHGPPKALMSLPIPPPIMMPNLFPPGYGEANFNEDQVKMFLRSQRERSQGGNSNLNQQGNSNGAKDRASPDHTKSGSHKEAAISSQPIPLFGPDSGSVMFGQSDSDTAVELDPAAKARLIADNLMASKEAAKLEAASQQLESSNNESRLFDRATASNSSNKSDNDNWYSSDDDAGKSDKTRKRKKRWDVINPDDKTTGPKVTQPPPVVALAPPPLVVPQPPAAPIANLSAKSAVVLPKELTDVLSSIAPKVNLEESKPVMDQSAEEDSSKTASSRDPRMNRDPRFARMQTKERGPAMSSPAAESSAPAIIKPITKPAVTSNKSLEEREKERKILEVDLSIFGDLEIPPLKEATHSNDEDDDNGLGLPFKPHRVQSVAKEIDASIFSHPPLDFKLRPINTPKPDYSSLVLSIPISRVQQDPRLRRYAKKRPLPLEPSIETKVTSPPHQSPTASTTAERPSDPRRARLEKQNSVHAGNSPTSMPVYNPKNDLYTTKPQQDYRPQEEVYSPSQDVHDTYGHHRGHADGGRGGGPSFAPGAGRDRNFYGRDNGWNERGDGDWPQQRQHRQEDDFYGEGNFYNDGQRAEGGFYGGAGGSSYDNYNNGRPMMAAAAGQPLHRGSPQHSDARLQPRRDPRRRD